MEGYYQMKPRKAVGLGALELSSHEKEILKRMLKNYDGDGVGWFETSRAFINTTMNFQVP